MREGVRRRLNYEVKESRKRPDDWIVGAIDYDSEGEVYTAAFSGVAAEERAREYAVWKNSQARPSSWEPPPRYQTDSMTTSTQV